MIQVKVPAIGESVTYAELTSWLAENGSLVEKDQEIAELDSDKASFTISAEESGVLKINAEPGKVNVGDIIAFIDNASVITPEKKSSKKPDVLKSENITTEISGKIASGDRFQITPVATEMIKQLGLNATEIAGKKNERITKNDVLNFIEQKKNLMVSEDDRNVTRKELSPLRKKLADRLVQVKNTTAMLTTFNETDMSRILEIRKKYGERFREKYAIKLGMMSFFARAVSIALMENKSVNAGIENDFILYHDFVDMGIAVSTDKGLLVPVIRNIEKMGIPEIEKQVQELAEKARLRKITLEEMAGGTFTITNGGVFGSLFSTPIINPPQAAILGMHAIQERPVGINGKIELRHMMYLALSYDHRLIDGKESVTFLVRIKELIEEPTKMRPDDPGNDEKLIEI